jgi:hypothetical protein
MDKIITKLMYKKIKVQMSDYSSLCNQLQSLPSMVQARRPEGNGVNRQIITLPHCLLWNQARSEGQNKR